MYQTSVLPAPQETRTPPQGKYAEYIHQNIRIKKVSNVYLLAHNNIREHVHRAAIQANFMCRRA